MEVFPQHFQRGAFVDPILATKYTTLHLEQQHKKGQQRGAVVPRQLYLELQQMHYTNITLSFQ